jgi:hypothetical protein
LISNDKSKLLNYWAWAKCAKKMKEGRGNTS